MENTVQPQPSAPPAIKTVSLLGDDSNKIPTVDHKAPLKIEAADTDLVVDTTDRYGTRIFFFGVIFCVIVVFVSLMIFLSWLHGDIQTPQVISTTQAK